MRRFEFNTEHHDTLVFASNILKAEKEMPIINLIWLEHECSVIIGDVINPSLN